MEKITIDLIPTGFNPLVYVSQNDDARTIRAYLTENKEPYTLTGSEVISLSVETPDKTIIESQIENTGANYLDFSIDPEITTKAGKCYSKIYLEDNGQKLGFSGFYIIVEKAP